MSWDEWEKLKADAAARGSTAMQLNQLAPEGGGGGRDLKSDKKAWVKAGEDTKGLQSDIGNALGKLDNGQPGLGELSGVQSAAAQKELYDSWKRYIGGVKGRCGELGKVMESAGHDLAKTDEAVKAELERIRSKYRDTEPVGGQTKGR